jgi:hypothetical protein
MSACPSRHLQRPLALHTPAKWPARHTVQGRPVRQEGRRVRARDASQPAHARHPTAGRAGRAGQGRQAGQVPASFESTEPRRLRPPPPPAAPAPRSLSLCCMKGHSSNTSSIIPMSEPPKLSREELPTEEEPSVVEPSESAQCCREDAVEAGAVGAFRIWRRGRGRIRQGRDIEARRAGWDRMGLTPRAGWCATGKQSSPRLKHSPLSLPLPTPRLLSPSLSSAAANPTLRLRLPDLPSNRAPLLLRSSRLLPPPRRLRSLPSVPLLARWWKELARMIVPRKPPPPPPVAPALPACRRLRALVVTSAASPAAAAAAASC